MICIGGVCVPTTAVVPVVLLVIRWTLAKLYVWGIVPEFIADLLNLKQIQLASTTEKQCCMTKQQQSTASTDSTVSSSSSSPSSTTTSVVKELESEEEFEELVNNDDNIVCMKFTASWCTPCKKIHPKYESLASKILEEQKKSDKETNMSFLTVDVDDYDAIASKYGVSMMPTFVIVQGGDGPNLTQVIGKMSGSTEAELESFMKKHLVS
mmetsp:Transcript_39349/g.95169  ORF Transcript_39349/g.95169 Transcript_39349/m.95169 type:complete len:210 (+) Transcript_39349:1384-2013(+)